MIGKVGNYILSYLDNDNITLWWIVGVWYYDDWILKLLRYYWGVCGQGITNMVVIDVYVKWILRLQLNHLECTHQQHHMVILTVHGCQDTIIIGLLCMYLLCFCFQFYGFFLFVCFLFLFLSIFIFFLFFWGLPQIKNVFKDFVSIRCDLWHILRT